MKELVCCPFVAVGIRSVHDVETTRRPSR
jgi:hypothetical protein